MKRVFHASLAAIAGAAILGAAMFSGMLSESAEAADNSTLRVGVYAKAPSRGNPYGGGGVPSIYWWDPIFDGFTRVNDKGQTVPWLAESWELVNATTWRFKLRQDVVFTNGEKMNADAAVATIMWMISDVGRATPGGRESRGITGATKVDDYTLDITTEKPMPLLAGTVSRAYVVAPKAWADMGIQGYSANPATSGAYKVKSWNDSGAEFVAYENTWRPPKIPTLKYVELPESAARLQALVSEQIDLAVLIAPDDVPVVRDAGQTSFTFSSPNIMNMVLMTEDYKKAYGEKGSPFKDKRVRLAMNMAIDRQAIVDNLLAGQSKPANQPANPATFGYNPDLPLYEYNPTKAKALLAEAGYPNGFELIAEIIPGAIPRDVEIYSYLADSFGKIGVKVDMRQIPFADWLKKFIGGGWEGAATGFSAFVDPHMDASRPFTNFSCYKQPNPLICIDDFMPLLDAQGQEMDRSKREAMLKELMAKSHNDALSLPILLGVDIYGATKRLKNFEYWNRVILWERMTLEGA